MIKEEVAGMTLDEMEQKLEQLTKDKKAFKKAILKPQMEVAKYRKAIQTADEQIDQLKELQIMAMGDQEQVDAEFYRFKMGTVNPETSRNWNLERDKDATPKELTATFEIYDNTLIKVTHSVNETEIKNRLASGELYVTPDGKIMDSNLKVLPGYSGSLKKPKISVKAKED